MLCSVIQLFNIIIYNIIIYIINIIINIIIYLTGNLSYKLDEPHQNRQKGHSTQLKK